VSGATAVYEINGSIARMIFDRNSDREFYLEESFPLDWTYSRLEPHGLILKVNRREQRVMSAETVQRDQDYWQPRLQEMIGGWLQADTPLKTVLDFAEKTYVRKDLSGFTGDLRFVHDLDSQLMFSKLRKSIAGVYAWRADQAGSDRQRMIDAADLAFRQALALCPYSPETNLRYSEFLVAQGRKADAIALLEAGLRQPAFSNPSPMIQNFTNQMTDALVKLKAQKTP
jgi:hypothetical protein